MVTLRTASPTKVSGQTTLRSSSLVTSWPGCPTRWLSTAKAFGLSLIACDPRHRHSFARSRQKGSKIICFSFPTVVDRGLTDGFRHAHNVDKLRAYSPL